MFGSHFETGDMDRLRTEIPEYKDVVEHVFAVFRFSSFFDNTFELNFDSPCWGY